YYESVEVPPGKDGLQIIGTSKAATIVDAGPFVDRGIPPVGDGIVIGSPRVVVRTLAVRNQQNVGVVIDAADVLVQGVRVDGATTGVLAGPNAHGARIIGNEIRSGLRETVSVVQGISVFDVPGVVVKDD